MERKKQLLGHFFAFFTILIWGTTLISTKILLEVIDPLQIVVYRFMMGFVVLFALEPKIVKPTSVKEEATFLLSGLTGVTMYMFSQNIALTYTTASNMALILCCAPLFTAGLFLLFVKAEKVAKTFILGFAFAIVGIFLVIYNGSVNLKVNPLGDILTIFAALCWGVYCVILRRIAGYKYSVVYETRKIFGYALLTMVPLVFILNINFNTVVFTTPRYLLNLFYLGAGASAACFVTWSKASDLIGGVKTSAYIYLSPIITMATSAIVLKEQVTTVMMAGFALILAGLYISDRKPKKKRVPVDADMSASGEVL